MMSLTFNIMKKVFKFLLGLLLFIIAITLFLPLSISNFIVCMVKGFNVTNYFRSTAVTMDKYANREFRTLWNACLRKPNGYPFGDPRETISSALGKNKEKGTLSSAGKVLCGLLDFIDKNHCINSIEEFDNSTIVML